MRVVMIVSAFPRLSETFIVSKFLGLRRDGWDVHLVCSCSAASALALFPDLASDGEARRRLHVAWPHRPRWIATALAPVAVAGCLVRAPRATWRYIDRGRKRFGTGVWRRLYLDARIVALDPDVLHFEFGALAVGRTYLRALLGCKVAVSFRGYDLYHSGLEDPDYYREVWRDASVVHVLGAALWRQAERRGCPADMPHVFVPPAVDVTAFDPGPRMHSDVVGTPNRPLRVVCVGRMEWKKGYEYVVHAIRLLRDSGIHATCRIIGDGRYLSAVAFARRQMGVEQEVALLGAMPRDAVRGELAQADVMLHAAVSEGFCNAVVEAQAMMLPVVSSDAGGLPDNVVDGVTGFAVPRRDPAALATKLAVLARDPALRQRMAVAGRERALLCFRIEDQIAAFGKLYRELGGERGNAH